MGKTGSPLKKQPPMCIGGDITRLFADFKEGYHIARPLKALGEI